MTHIKDIVILVQGQLLSLLKLTRKQPGQQETCVSCLEQLSVMATHVVLKWGGGAEGRKGCTSKGDKILLIVAFISAIPVLY